MATTKVYGLTETELEKKRRMAQIRFFRDAANFSPILSGWRPKEGYVLSDAICLVRVDYLHTVWTPTKLFPEHPEEGKTYQALASGEQELLPVNRLWKMWDDLESRKAETTLTLTHSEWTSDEPPEGSPYLSRTITRLDGKDGSVVWLNRALLNLLYDNHWLTTGRYQFEVIDGGRLVRVSKKQSYTTNAYQTVPHTVTVAYFMVASAVPERAKGPDPKLLVPGVKKADAIETLADLHGVGEMVLNTLAPCPARTKLASLLREAERIRAAIEAASPK